MSPQPLTVRPVHGIGEIRPGDDLAELIVEHLKGEIADGDIVVVTSKIVSKAENRILAADNRHDAIAQETVRVVAEKVWPGGSTKIVENRLGLILAAAGVDASNTPEGTVLLLPKDPDESAHRICVKLREIYGLNLGVIITDTLGRPWRLGQTDVAIGAAGVSVMEDLSGTTDDFGAELSVTMAAVADQIAGAANLVTGKTSRCPVSIVTGRSDLVLTHLPHTYVPDAGEHTDQSEREAFSRARDIIRPMSEDLFSLGTQEAYEAGLAEGRKLLEHPNR